MGRYHSVSEPMGWLSAFRLCPPPIYKLGSGFLMLVLIKLLMRVGRGTEGGLSTKWG